MVLGMDLLISTGLGMIGECIAKVTAAVAEKSGSSAMSSLSPEVMGRIYNLRPQLDLIDEHVRNLSESNYKAVMSLLKHALLIIYEGSSDQFNFTALKAGQTLSYRERVIPEAATQHAYQAYDRATTAFNDSNLSVAERVRCLQAMMLCIGILHYNEPDKILARWRECIKDLLSNPSIRACIRSRLGTNRFKKLAYTQHDLQQLRMTLMDAINSVKLLYGNSPVANQGRNEIIRLVVSPEGISEGIERKRWRNLFHGFQNVLEFRGNPTALSTAGFILVSNEQGLQVIREEDGEIFATIDKSDSSVVFDPAGPRILCYAAESREIFAYNEGLQYLESLKFPMLGSWILAATTGGVLVCVCRDLRRDLHRIHISVDNGESWSSVDALDKAARRAYGLHIKDGLQSVDHNPSNVLQLALELDVGLYRVDVRFELKANFSTLICSQRIKALANPLTVSCCTVDESGSLIIAGHAEGLFVLDCGNWTEVLWHLRDEELNHPMALSARHGNIYVQSENMAIRKYIYFV